MRMILPALSLLLLGGAAQAQVSATSSVSSYDTIKADPMGQGGDAPAKPADEGRFVPNDRDGLASRGGRTDTARTYGATIGQPMGSTIGSVMGTTLPLSQPR